KTKDTLEVQELARRMVLEAPPSKSVEPLLWQLAMSGRAENRVEFLSRAAAYDFDDKAIARWQKLVADPESPVREKALEVLAVTTNPERPVRMRALDVLHELAKREQGGTDVGAVRDE